MIATANTVTERVPFSAYLEIKALNASSLKHMLVSPLMYQRMGLKPREDNDTLRAGRAGHTAILEPNRFLAEYWQWETERSDGSKRIRRGMEYDDACLANAGKTELTPTQFATAILLRDLVRDHPVAGPLVKGIGRNELSLQWTHERTGERCKGRIDRIATGRALIDIKTCRDPLPHAFGAVAERLGYFMQMAFYSDGVAACGLGELPAKIIAVQNCEPFDVWVYDVELEELESGRTQYEGAIDRVLECRKNNAWPGGAVEGSVPLRRPGWATLGGGDSDPFANMSEVIS